MFVIAERTDEPRKLLFMFPKLVYHPILSFNSCSNVSAVSASFEAFLALVVRTKTWHVKPITNVDNNVRLKIMDKLAKPSVPFVTEVRMSVAVRNYQMRLGQFEGPS